MALGNKANGSTTPGQLPLGHGKSGRQKWKHEKLQESDYIVSGYDAKGRSDMVQLRILPGYARMASEVMAHGKFPFKTQGDLYRWAIAYGIDHLTNVEPPPHNIMGFIKMENATINDQKYMREQSQTLDQLEELIKYHASQDNFMNKLYAKALLAQSIERTKLIADTTFRRNHLAKIKKRFKWVEDMKVEMPSRVTLNPDNWERGQTEEEEEE